MGEIVVSDDDVDMRRAGHGNTLSPPLYLYALLAVLAGGGSGYMLNGDEVTVAELSRDLTERDRRISHLEKTVSQFELRCQSITERVIRVEVALGEQLDNHLNGWPRFDKFNKSRGDQEIPEVLAGLMPCTTERVKAGE
jgi:hypothetical protein